MREDVNNKERWRMVMRVREELMEKGKELEIKRKGKVAGLVRNVRRAKWRVVGIYVNGNIVRKLQKLGD